MNILLSIYSLIAFATLPAQDTQSKFDIYFDDDKVGHFTVTQTTTGTKNIRDLKTVSETKIIAILFHVETEAKVIRQEGKFVEGTGYRHANRGIDDIHSQTTHISDNNYEIKKNGKSEVKKDYTITWCITDLFFKEPKGLTHIYSNMHGQKLRINHMGNGRYQVVSPGDKYSYYIYKNGVLVTVEADTPVGKVISTKV